MMLQSGDVSLPRAERDLLNLDVYQAARRRRLGRDLIEFLQWGMELEDVVDLSPEALRESFDQMRLLARKVLARTSLS